MFDFRNIPPVVKNLLIINGLFFLASIFFYKGQGLDLVNYLGLHFWQSPGFYPHQIISYMFMHAYIDPRDMSLIISHILFNMFALFMFGRVLEQVWGSKRFLIFYMVTGIGAGIAQLLVAKIRLMLVGNIDPLVLDKIMTEGYQIILQKKNYIDPYLSNLNSIINGPTIGASGSVYGVLIAFAMLFPNTELMLIFPPIPIKAKYMVFILIVMALFFGFGNFSGDNVAHFAHLGGALAGFILVKIWKQDRGHFY